MKEETMVRSASSSLSLDENLPKLLRTQTPTSRCWHDLRSCRVTGVAVACTARLVCSPSTALLITKTNYPARHVPEQVCPEAWELQASISGGPVKGKPAKQAMPIIH